MTARDVAYEQLRDSDKSDMMGEALSYPDLLTRAVEAEQAAVDLPRQPSRILCVGMGGSAISGDYLSAWLDAEGRTPLLVSRAYDLPNWVDADTLVLAFSYSGNTEETLAAFAAAKDRGAMLAAVSTGNRLEELANKYEAPFARVEGGHQPRAALCCMLGTAAMTLDRAGLLKARQPLVDAATALRDEAARYHPDVPAEENPAKLAALDIHGRVAAVYASGALAPTATRFANQLNENGKVLAWHGQMPEMNHNELVAWGNDDALDRFTTVFLRHGGEHPQEATRYQFTGDAIRERGGRVVEFHAEGETVAHRLLSASLIGDAASVYLAALRGIDPTPVDIITKLKQTVAESGFAAKLG